MVHPYVIAAGVMAGGQILSGIFGGKGARSAANAQLKAQERTNEYNSYATNQANMYNAAMDRTKSTNLLADRSRDRHLNAFTQYAAPGARTTMSQVANKYPYEEMPNEEDYKTMAYNDYFNS